MDMTRLRRGNKKYSLSLRCAVWRYFRRALQGQLTMQDTPLTWTFSFVKENMHTLGDELTQGTLFRLFYYRVLLHVAI